MAPKEEKGQGGKLFVNWRKFKPDTWWADIRDKVYREKLTIQELVVFLLDQWLQGKIKYKEEKTNK